eukprot:168564-Amphidinium_carterae.3
MCFQLLPYRRPQLEGLPAASRAIAALSQATVSAWSVDLHFNVLEVQGFLEKGIVCVLEFRSFVQQNVSCPGSCLGGGAPDVRQMSSV